jgi:hypothetical protein
VSDQDFYPPTSGGAELAHGALRGKRWSLRAFRRQTLAPLPGNEERFVLETCVQLRSPRSVIGGGLETTRACIHPDDMRARESFALDQRCDRIGITGAGMVASDVRAVVAVLGDGAVRRLPLRALPRGYAERRAFALVLGRRTAVRRIVALIRDGHHRVLQGSIGPARLRCGYSASVLYLFSDEPPTPRGPAALTVYDEGIWICATLGRPTRQPGECRRPPLDAEDAWMMSRRQGGRDFIAGVVPAAVKQAVVQLRSGGRIVVEAQPDQDYNGRYASVLRFFSVSLEPGQSVAAIRLVDSSGRRFTARGFFDEPRGTTPPRVVVPGPLSLRLRANWLGWPGEPDAWLCLRLGSAECGFSSTFGIQGIADCAPRRLVLWGVLPRGRSSVTIETDRGDVRARVRPLPAALREQRAQPRFIRRFAGVSAFVAAVPGNAIPTGLVIGGRRPHRRRLVLPPASAQCGYEDFLFSP